MNDWGLGYRIEDEDPEYLLETSTPIRFSAAEGSLPESVSFRKKGLRIENQGQQGSSGVMTFIVNHDGVVYQKNLGPGTEGAASKMRSYDPDASWKAVQ